MKTKTTLTEKGQITIPIKIRRMFGLTAGQKLEFETSGGMILLHKAVSRKEMDKVRGCLRTAESTTDYLNKTRGEVDLPSGKNGAVRRS